MKKKRYKEATSGELIELEADWGTMSSRVQSLEDQLNMARREKNPLLQVASQLDIARADLKVTLDMETRLGDIRSKLQRLASMDASLAKPSSLLGTSFAEGIAKVATNKQQHDDGVLAESGG